MTPFTQASTFLIETIFDFYLLFVMLRFLLQLFRAEFYNPVSQLVVKLTNPALIPLRRIIPGYAGIDWASVMLLLIVVMFKLSLLLLIQFHHFPSILGLIVWGVGDLLSLAVHIFFFAVLIQIVASWITPHSHNPVLHVIHCLTHPILNRARRLIPSLGGFDLSPVPVMISLQLLIILVTGPIAQTGAQLALK